MFITEYILGGEIPGQPSADLKLSVDTMRKTETGNVTINQAVNPPLKLITDVHGSYVELACANVSNLLGEFPLAAGAPEFGATLAVKTWGEPGTGWFWWTDAKGRHEIGPVAAKYVEVAATATR